MTKTPSKINNSVFSGRGSNLTLKCLLAGALIVPGLTVGRDVPPNAPEFRYIGCVAVDLNAERARFDRVINDPAGFRYDAPGARIVFRTDATSVTAHFRFNGLHNRRDAVNGFGIVMVDGKKGESYKVEAINDEIQSVPLWESADAAMRDMEVCLPYGESVDFLGLTVNDNASVLPVPPKTRPRYVAYGDSITHGFRAKDVLSTYPVLVAQSRDWELINLGFGSRQASADDGRIIGSVPADIITILIGFNDHYGNKPLDRYRSDVNGILENIRVAQPKTPIFLITPLWSSEPFPTNLGLRLEDYRQVLREIVTEEKDANLHIIEGTDLIPADAKFFTDGVHPNDDGFHSLAEKLAPRLQLNVPQKP